MTFTQVGPADGTLVTVPAAACAGERFGGTCMTFSVDTRAEIGLTVVGLLGIEVPTQCETSEPVDFPLHATLTLGELLNSGPGFTGTVTIPSITCGGIDGLLLGPVVTGLMSGPENPYALHIGPHELGPATVAAGEASSITQISAKLAGTVEPNGSPAPACTSQRRRARPTTRAPMNGCPARGRGASRRRRANTPTRPAPPKHRSPVRGAMKGPPARASPRRAARPHSKPKGSAPGRSRAPRAAPPVK